MTSSGDGRVWLVTGAGRGLGRAFTDEAVSRGDRVIATVRSGPAARDLAGSYPDSVLALELDVADRGAVGAVVQQGLDRFGRIDVLVNNAGYGLAGGIEEVSEEQARRQLDVNFFGALWCTQAVVPAMRAQRSGHIFQISSMGGVVANRNTGLYHASKWALEGLSESLALEVGPFGIGVTIVEPGPFRSDWNGGSMDRAEPMPEYAEVLAARRDMLSGALAFTQPGNPQAAAQALYTVLEAERPPLRLLLGVMAADAVPAAYETRLAEWRAWDSVARAADFT